MSVQVKKDGNTYCVYRDGGPPIWEPFGKGKDAYIAATERDLEIKKGKRAGRKHNFHSDDLTFAELYQIYADGRTTELSEKMTDEIFNTVSLYAIPVIGEKLCRRITIDDWQTMQKAMVSRELKNRSINKYFQYISKVISWGIKNVDALKAMPHPWALREPLRSVECFQIELFDLKDLQKIIEHSPEHLKWTIEVEYNTGVRPGPTELFNMKWEDIDFTTGAIRIYPSKTASHQRYHTQYISQAFLKRLEEKRKWYREEAARLAKRRGKILPECPYVISYHGERITGQVAKSWEEAKIKAAITKPIRLYDIRHFYITHALANGANIQDLANRVGHKNANMIVNVYSHLVEEMRSKKAFAIPDLNVDGAVDNSELLDETVRLNEKEASD